MVCLIVLQGPSSAAASDCAAGAWQLKRCCMPQQQGPTAISIATDSSASPFKAVHLAFTSQL